MKKMFLVLILITTIMIQTQAQTTDVQLIETTIGHYFDGLVDHKPESLKKAFVPSASMKWIEKGVYIEVNALDALIDYVTKNPAVKAKAQISSITVTGDAANAKLEIEYETFTFVDFMHLLKIDGEWKIVSKTYTTIPKEF
ncbi:MAG: nuclear transport factor 2 family protein [Saprospiraceae bacterium]